MGFPVSVRSSFAPSAALQAHIERSAARAFRPHAERVARVELRLRDTNGPRRGEGDKLARVVLTLSRGRRIITAAASDDLYTSVTRALLRARHALARRLASRRSAARAVRT